MLRLVLGFVVLSTISIVGSFKVDVSLGQCNNTKPCGEGNECCSGEYVVNDQPLKVQWCCPAGSSCRELQYNGGTCDENLIKRILMGMRNKSTKRIFFNAPQNEVSEETKPIVDDQPKHTSQSPDYECRIFKCHEGRKVTSQYDCLVEKDVCNGYDDCVDGEDETPESCTGRPLRKPDMLFNDHIHNEERPAGSDVDFICWPYANYAENVTYIFYRDGEKIKESSNQVLIIENLEVSDSGKYSCKVLRDGKTSEESYTRKIVVKGDMRSTMSPKVTKVDLPEEQATQVPKLDDDVAQERKYERRLINALMKDLDDDDE